MTFLLPILDPANWNSDEEPAEDDEDGNRSDYTGIENDPED